MATPGKKGAGAHRHPISNEFDYILSGEKEQLVNKRLLQAQKVKGGLTVPPAGSAKGTLFAPRCGEVRGADWDEDNG
jgi:uncharacterized cupin superfamily protein